MTTLPAAGPTAGSRRFWITVLCFLVANLAAWVGYYRWQELRLPRRDILAVELFAPGDDAVVSNLKPLLSWTFNLDAGQPGPAAGPSGSAPGSIEPSVKGNWTWVDARTLTFEPSERLNPATPFTVKLNAVISPAGFTLPAGKEHHFSTQPLTLVSVRQVAFDGQQRVLLELEFNDKVIPGEVLRHLEITTSAGKTVHAVPQGEGAGTTVRVLTDEIDISGLLADRSTGPVATLAIIPPARPAAATPAVPRAEDAAQLRITLTPGLAGTSGPLGLNEAVTREVRIAQVLLADSLEGIPGEATGDLVITFNNNVAQETVDNLKPLLKVDPPVEFTLRQRSEHRQVQLEGDFIPGTRYTVRIEKPSAGDDRRKYPRPATLSAVIPDRSPSFSFADSQGFLGSNGNRTVLVRALNVSAIRVRADRVYENNIVAWRNAHRGGSYSAEYAQPLASRRYVVGGKRNQTQEIHINLDDLLGAGKAIDGVYRLEVAVDEGPANGGDDAFWQRVDRWDAESTLVSLSDIGLTAKLMASPQHTGTERSLLAWALSLSASTPLADMHVRVYSSKNQLLGEGVTDAQGLAQIDHLNPNQDEEPSIVIATRGSAAAGESAVRTAAALTWLDLRSMQRSESAFATNGRSYLREGYEAFLWPERGVYRPGENVLLRAIVRGPGVSTPAEKMPLRWQLRRPDGRDWISQKAELDADGATELRVTIPADAPTGYFTTQLGLPGDPAAGSDGMTAFGTADFQVEEFIPNRIKTTLAIDGKPQRYTIGREPLTAQVQADYLFGQPAAHLRSTLSVHLSPASFVCDAFPAAQGWQAGDTAHVVQVFAGSRPSSVHLDPASLELDDAGHGRFAINLLARTVHASLTPTAQPAISLPAPPPASQPADLCAFHGPWHVTLADETAEVGGRAITAYGALEADALPNYIMVRPSGDRTPQVGQSVAFDVRLVTPAGTAISPDRPLDAQVFHETWNNSYQRINGRYQYESTRMLEPVKGSNAPVAFENAAGIFTWKPTAPGSYVVQFADGQQITSASFYVSDPGNSWEQGGHWADTISRDHPEQLDVQLIAADGSPAADKTKALFHEGQAVRALIRSPFAGRLLLTIETDAVLLRKVVDMSGDNAAEVPLELPAGLWPNGYVSAMVVRPVDTTKEWRTHRAYGITRFAIDPADQRLNIQVNTPKEMRPLQTLDVGLAVTDSHGQAVRHAAVAVAAVDEGILALTGYQTPQPLGYFASTRALGVQTADIYSLLMPEVQKLDGSSAVGGDGGFVERHTSPVAAKRVKPVALTSAIVHTDDAGKAVVHMQVPEFLGQLRIMAVAYAGSGGRGLGSADGTVLVRSPLVVESSFPRFLAPGDRCQIPLMVFNNSEQSGPATVRLTADNSRVLAFNLPQQVVTLAAHQQKTVTFEMTAQQGAGIGQISLEATLGSERYTEHLEISVRPASPTVTLGDALTVTAGEGVNLKLPPAMLPGSETFELRISQRPVLNVPAGLAYLDHYPYGCLEQTTSQCFPLAYLPDIGQQLAPGVFDQDRVGRKVNAGILRLVGMQTASGGLSMWPGPSEDWPWGTIYAAHFLVEAQHAGYQVPADFQARLDGYLHSLLLKSTSLGETAELQAYAAYVLALEGNPHRSAMNRLGEVLAEAKAHGGTDFSLQQAELHLALAWAASGRKDLAEKLLPQQLPAVRPTRQLCGNVGSPVRDQALMIMTLLTVSPDHPALPGLVEKLSASGTDRGWLSSQDNAFAVLALGKYLRATRDDKPFERAELLQGSTVLAQATDKPLLWSATDQHDNLSVRVAGPDGAKGYISWLQTGVPTQMPADADHALKIRRQYLLADGTPLPAHQPIATGTSLRVMVTVETPTDLNNLVLEDLLPAGLEAENPRLANTKHDAAPAAIAIAGAPAPRMISWPRLDVRDDRVIAVGAVPSGVSAWSYLVRAVTPGTYIIPPVRGECMYDPSINSLSGGGAQLVITSVPEKEVAMP